MSIKKVVFDMSFGESRPSLMNLEKRAGRGIGREMGHTRMDEIPKYLIAV
jgi:hypothetical protein